MMRDFLENVGVMIVGSMIVLGMTALYWICRIFGVEVDE